MPELNGGQLAFLLQGRFARPVISAPKVEGQPYKVSELTAHIRAALRAVPDIERAVARLSAGRGGPHDLSMVRAGLRAAESLRPVLRQACARPLDSFVSGLEQSAPLQALGHHLERALVDEPAFSPREGGFIRKDFHAELDALRLLKSDGRKTIAQMESAFRADTGVESLKITYNNVLGYFIEVPARRADSLSVRKDHTENPYIHRQTTASAVRFTTVALSDLERRMAGAEAQALAVELSVFADMAAQVSEQAGACLVLARTLAELDVAAGLAERAADQDHVRPVLTSDADFTIEGGRHPVVERSLREAGERFVPNDCNLGPQTRLWLLTGPNMAGKSTFLRQNALIALLAQAGSYVPAAAAHIGLVSQIFSRVGASDDLARGRSTFMVEMVETAAILNQADDRALVILDLSLIHI